MKTAAVSPPSEVEELVGRIADEFTERLNRGEQPEIEEYAARHPEIAELLRQVLPALELIRLPGGADPGGGTLESGVLGDYRILGELGRGGMGVVYKAEQISLGRTVALKVLPFAGALDARQLMRFQNEARAAACLHHPNIVPVFAIGCERAVHFYAMQYIEGESLEALLQEMRHARKPPPPAQADDPDATSAEPRPAIGQAERETLREPRGQASTLPSPKQKLAYFRRIAELGIEAARALDHAHEVGVIHRDIKPANLMLDGHGKLWMTDFGLAQIRTDTRLTMTGDLVGTLRYMSPEQALAKRVIVDHRTDIYSLGATLYELLTLEPVFDGADRQELLRQIAFEDPKPLRRHNDSVPAEFETIVLKALEKNPADRYATAKDFADDLERFAKDEPIHARRPSVTRRLRNYGRRHKTMASGVAIFLLALLLWGGASLWQRTITAQAVENDLQEANGWQRLEQWAQARQALERAKGRLAESGLDSLRAKVERRRRELDLIAQLEEARMKAVALSPDFNRNDHFIASDRAYATAFTEFDLDVTALPAEEAARRIRASSIPIQLVIALDHWAYVKGCLPNANDEPLRTVAQMADDNAWRQRLRDPKVAKARKALAQLAEEDGVLDQPPASLLILSSLLKAENARPEALLLLRRAQRRYPADFRINFDLGMMLGVENRTDRKARASEAARFFQAALALQPQNPHVYIHLADAIGNQGLEHESEAQAAVRKAIDLNPNLAQAYYFLGNGLRKENKLPDAEKMFRKAIELEPDNGRAQANLFLVLHDQRKFSELEKAIVLYEQTLEKQKTRLGANYVDTPGSMFAQGIAYDSAGRLQDAVKAFRKAILLDPDSSRAHFNLGLSLLKLGQLTDAEAPFRKAVALEPDHYDAHQNLFVVLLNQGKLADAEVASRKAIEIQPDFANAHFFLGMALQDQGQFADGLTSLKRAQELHSQRPDLPIRIRQAEQLVAFDAKLPKILKGEIQPADTAERLALARFCCLPGRRFNAAAARFYSEAFAAEPKLADDLDAANRYNAACVAALAGCGQGNDAANLEPQETIRLRGQALAWLRADLTARQVQLEKEPDKIPAIVQKEMRHWQQDRDFAGVRGDEALAKLPEAERQEWRMFWEEVATLERRATASPPR